MAAVIDAECFQSQHGLIVRELAVVKVDLDASSLECAQHCLFEAPFDESLLRAKHRRCNRWLTAHMHGFEWAGRAGGGGEEYTLLPQILRAATSLATEEIFCKGEEKRKLFSALVQRPVINLETAGLPKLSEVGVEPSLSCKFGHRFSDHHCALQKACLFAKWLLQQQRAEGGYNIFYL